MIPIHRIVLAVALVAPPPLSAQPTVRVVDPYGSTGYPTITSAALASAAGDTIQGWLRFLGPALSFRVIEEQGKSGVYLWELSRPGSGDVELSTKLFNCIFDRGIPGTNDFAADTIGLLVPDSGTAKEAAFNIGVTGCRYVQIPDPDFPFDTQDQPPFPEYGLHWESLDPTYFYLENTQNDFGVTPTYVQQLYSEADFDHQGDVRPPSSSGTRDKGAEEKN